MKEEYKRGDVVYWWSDIGGYKNRTKAMFVKYDEYYPEFQDAILAIKISTFKQAFRWPLRLMEHVEEK
jgi:hypothetical protein